MAVRRALLVSLAALLLAGCGFGGESVPLLTATEPHPEGLPDGSCLLWWGQGELIESATAGTAARQPAGVIITLRWPMGYTARRSGGSVEVLDSRGQVVAVTGRKYQFWTSAWYPPGPWYTGGPGCVEEIASFYGE
jgi:hypothetical protein